VALVVSWLYATWAGGLSGCPMESGFSVNQCALPGAVPSIRRAVSRFLDPYDLPASLVADIGLAVSEACGNVVRHAYPNGPGDVRCDARIADDEVVVVVSDWGCGVKAPSYRPGLGLGLGLMGMLSDSLIVDGGDGGTQVTLRFVRYAPA